MQEELDHLDVGVRLGRRTLLFFWFGQFSRSLVWCVTDLLIGYHLIDRIGLSGRVAGTLLLVSFAFGALLNIVVAAWVARLGKPTSNALRLQAIFGIASLVIALLMFGPVPPGEVWKIVYLCTVSTAFRIAYTIFDVSQNALISLLPRSRAEVRGYVTTKIVASSAGRLMASLLVFVALRAPLDDFADLKAVSWMILPVMMSLLGLARVAAPEVAKEPPAPRFEWRWLPWRRLAVPLVATIFEVGLLGLICRLLPLFGDAKPGFAGSSSLVVAMVCGTIAGPAITYVGNLLVARRFSLVPIISFCTIVAGVELLFPHGEVVCLALAFAYGAALTGLTNLIWEQMALIVVDEAAATGMRIDVPAFALLSASVNIAIGLSNGLLAAILDGFKNGAPSSLTMIAAILVLGGLGTIIVLLTAPTQRNSTSRA